MVNAGASIEAFLKLDATDFNSGIKKASESVKVFKESMVEIGANTGAVKTGIKTLTQALGKLVTHMSLFKNLANEVQNFKTFAQGLEYMATAAQRLSRVSEQGSVGISALQEVIKIWATGVQSAEAPVVNLTAKIRDLGNASKDSATKLSSAQQVMRSQFQLLEATLDPTIGKEEEARAITQRLSKELGLSGRELVNVRNRLLETGMTVDQYIASLNKEVQWAEKVNMSNQKMATSFNTVKTTLQSWKSLTDSIVNTTLQRLPTSTNNITTSIGNLTTGINTTKNAMEILRNSTNGWIGTLNSTDGTIKRATTGVVQYANAIGPRMATQINASRMSVVNLKNVFDGSRMIVRSLTQSMMTLGSQLERNRAINQSMITGEELYFKSIEEVNSAIMQNSNAMRQNAEAKLRAMGYTGRLSVEEERLSATSNQASSSIQRTSSSMRQATTSANNMTRATSALGKGMSSLRMIGTMVASMMVWNFAHNLVTATRETVNAKSEMEGYFKMLHFSQGEVDDFNKALDQTVSRFQRINKYSLGETISSIGVEFELSTEEMKKAMPVVSMITSEYLRAGRNVNEASLAVKDILQGEFQRLSRETGVKGDQLKEAGWSGDKSDVMGLLEALDKVGKSRNWDTFVVKANSLNDAVLILQNRFGEWSADMVNVVQPTILGVFNTLMTVGGVFGQIMTGVWEWLNGDGIANQIVKWTGLATAIGLVSGAYVVYRTGANAVQLVQMGLRGSITATILKLNAEEVATYGTKNAIASKITTMKAETVATIGVRKAIVAKTLGLNEEKVAQFGLRGAIMEASFAEEYQTAVREGANAKELEAIALKWKLTHEELTTTQAIYANVLGLNYQTVAQKGGIVALAERIASSKLYRGALKAEEVAQMSTARASLFLFSTLLPYVAVITAIAIALYGLIAPLQQASEEMKKFNKLVEDGDNLIQSSKKTWDSFIKQEEELTEKQSELTEGTKEYLRVSKQIEQVQKNKEVAEKDYYNTVKAVEMARSSQTKYEERYAQIGIEAQTELADAYIKAGISAEEAYELANDNLADAKNGAKQLREALQMIKLEQERGSKKTSATIDMLDQYGLSDDKIKEYGERFRSANEKIREGMAKFMTSDDLMERIGGWGELQLGRLEEWWTRFNAFFEVRDWESMGKMIHDGFMSVWRMLPWNKMFEDIGKSIQTKGLIPTIMNALFGEGDSDGALDIIWQFMNDVIIQPLGEWLGWFMEDPFANFDKVTNDISLKLAQFLFGKDENNTLKEITGKWFDDFTADLWDSILDYFSVENILSGGFTFGGIGVLTSAIPKLLFGEDASIESIVQSITDYFSQSFNSVGTALPILVDLYIIQPISTSIWNGILSIPLVGDFIQLLGLVTDENVGASEKGRAIGNWIGNALTFAIGQIPIVGDILRMLGLIPNTYSDANNKGYGVGDNVKSGEASGHKGMAENVSTEVGRIIEYLKNSDTLQGVFDAGFGIGGKILGGVKGGLGISSPGILAREVIPTEFGEHIPNAITDSSSIAYASAQSYAQNMYDGMNSVQNNGFGLGGVVDEYQADAQVITNSSQMMGSTTTSAFNDMSSTVNATTGQMATDVGSQYTSMQQKQGTMLNTMKTQNLSAYNDMYLKSNQSLVQMRDSTSNVTNQMTNAWNHMKDNIIASANQLKSQSTSHFNQLSSTIGDFYGKIQNPSRWGSGPSSPSNVATRSPRRSSTGRAVARAFTRRGAGGNLTGGKHTGSPIMTVAQAKRMLCPTGDCGSLFEGYSLSDKIDITDWMANLEGEHGFGWSDWHNPHYNYIRTTSNEWGMKSPRINLVGGIDTDATFKVGEFENGRPNVSFSTFQSIAGSIFSRIPYRMYYDSSWKGSWLGALQAGACNCSDGADALIALASVFGFSGYKQWGKWGNTGHFWAVINGVPMDTTAWQGGYGWTSPKVSGYGPTPRRATPSTTSDDSTVNKTVNITNDFTGATIYGMDDLDDKIQESTRKALREEFNDSYSVVI